MYITPLLKGLVTFIPGVYKLIPKSSQGSISARYCYSVWLRHIIMAAKNGLPTQPETVAELGPGHSLGIGLSALISGSRQYYAFDIVKLANNKTNLEVLEELIELFRKRENMPDETEFPNLTPRLESYNFPSHILTNERLDETLQPHRLQSIRKALLNGNSDDEYNITIAYFVPWFNHKIIQEESVDMIYSQAVLEHIDDLEHSYKVCSHWLKRGGFISNVIDFKSHRLAELWNGHWLYSDTMWKLIKGRRPFLINREPYSTHIKLLEKYNFKIICNIKTKSDSVLRKEKLALRFKNLSDEDFVTSDVFIQAVIEK